MGRNLARLQENWESLPKNPTTGEVIRREDDYLVRRGQCSAPVSTIEQFPFTVTHKVSGRYLTDPV